MYNFIAFDPISNNKFLSQKLSETLMLRSNLEVEINDIIQNIKDKTELLKINIGELISNKKVDRKILNCRNLFIYVCEHNYIHIHIQINSILLF